MHENLVSILNKMDKIKFFTRGLPQIEKFEDLILQVREYDDFMAIGPLCGMLVEESECGSATEAAIETILILIEKHGALAMRELLKATPVVIKQGETWLEIMYRMIWKDENLKMLLEEEYAVVSDNLKVILSVIFDFKED